MPINASYNNSVDVALPNTPEQVSDPKVFNELMLVYRAIKNLQAQVAANISAAAPNQHVPTVTVYTSGSGTYTVPAGVKRIVVRMVGGGGGGSGSTSNVYSGSGGGCAAYCEKNIVNPSATYSYAVGAGGAAGGGGANGGTGGTTTFGTLSAAGGNGGYYAGNNLTANPTASGGDINLQGVQGQGGGYSTGQIQVGGMGASSILGGGGGGGIPGSGIGIVGDFGAGGGGAGQLAGGTGGAGGGGIIIITEYYNY